MNKHEQVKRAQKYRRIAEGITKHIETLPPISDYLGAVGFTTEEDVINAVIRNALEARAEHYLEAAEKLEGDPS